MEPSRFTPPVHLRSLKEPDEIIDCFVELAERHLASAGGGIDEMTPELRILAGFCNHQRETLFRYARDPANASCRVAGWIMDLATTPSMDWVHVRHHLQPLIRRFGMPPRPRGMPLLTPG